MEKKAKMTQHIDKNVIYLFLAAFLISASTLAYRYIKMAPCDEVVFTSVAKEYRAGELIKFIDKTEGAKFWEWKFDDSTRVSTEKEPLHIFKEPGEYTVTLMVNDLCIKKEVITIKEKKEVIDPSKLPVFEVPNSIVLGEPLKVIDKTNNASTWEWRFGETVRVDADTKQAEYIYKEPGLKTISLVVNGDLKHITRKKINVLPIESDEEPITQISIPDKPKGWSIKHSPLEKNIKEAPSTVEPTKPKTVPYISEKEFTRRMIMVSDEEMDVKQFTEYFCGDINKPVISNGKNTTFLVLCEKIRGRKIKIKKLDLYRDKGSNCIKNLIIDYRKSLF
ncbi:PKD domain-containing protein [Cochleicola gelatinilyticus]|uniref:PKD domain-containing protein n=1 Tax=Cochleicola gelatinilyticus TaxID=1763537 RepID=A0A167HLX8_9FLAO|nr:PKD domain-containing protein [Cochleicola gelatinilyticus]OAB78751.1 hypothetical protein ULVI_09215 [Cochleicola gelatinilyticus]